MKANWLRILLVIVLLMGANVACVSGDQVQQWLDQLVQDATQAIEQWAREQMDRLIEDVKQEIQEALEQFLTNLRNSIWPPAPTISEPGDGTVVDQPSISVRGEGAAATTVTLFRNGRSYRDAPVDEHGRWSMDGLALHAGENTLTAKITSGLFPSPASNAVTVRNTAPEEPVTVPGIEPHVDPGLDRDQWMLDLALILLSEDGNTFYEGQRRTYLRALRQGLATAQADETVHHYIDLRFDRSFGKYIMVQVVPGSFSREDAVKAALKAVEASVFKESVQRTLKERIQESLELLEVTTVIEAGGVEEMVRHVRIDLDEEWLVTEIDPRSLVKLRTQLASSLVETLAGNLAREAVRLRYAVWGGADANIQAQRYYDLALLAWSYDGDWGDWDSNGFDYVEGVRFDTNQEWASFYLGQAAFYMQLMADPYYTIPPYKPKEELLGLLSEEVVTRLAKMGTERVFGKVIGAATPIGQFIIMAEFLDILQSLGAALDQMEIQNVHRPNFERFVNGDLYDYAMPEPYRDGGAINERAGYPFRSSNDLALHLALESIPGDLKNRETIRGDLSIRELLEERRAEFFTGRMYDPIDRLARALAERASRYVHGGRLGQSDMRIPEGNMIIENSYTVREVYTYRFLNRLERALWQAEPNDYLRVILTDGSVIEGRVVDNPGRPLDYPYLNTSDPLNHETWLHILPVDDLRYVSGSMPRFPYGIMELIMVDSKPQHVYASFDRVGGNIRDMGPGWTNFVVHFIGMTGEVGERGDYEESDGVAAIAADSLLMGSLATAHLLGKFSADVPTFEVAAPSVVGLRDLAVTLGSPAELHLYDARGRHIGPNAAGGVDLEIPGARYFQTDSPEQTIIFVPDAGPATNYRVRVDGTGTGEASIETFVGDRRSSTVSHQAYLGIPVTSSTRAELNLHPTDPAPLALDVAGDSTFESQHEPAESDVLQVYEARKSVLDAILAIVQTRPELLAVAGGIVLALLAGGILWHRRRRRGGPPAPPGIRTCPRCGTPSARPTSRFCGRCGTRLP